jgi:hypothetical protein
MEFSEKRLNILALEQTQMARYAFEEAICAASESRDQEVLDALQLQTMYELAEFYFTIDAMDLNGPDDIIILVDLHNKSIDALLKDRATLRRRHLNPDTIEWAGIKKDSHMIEIWRTAPGSLDQSNLARFLIKQMSSEKVRRLVIAAAQAGFLTRQETGKSIIVRSTGVMESIFNDVLRDMRLGISQLTNGGS